MGDDDDSSTVIKIGPVGSTKGDSWDEKGNTKIVQIFISHEDEINSIQFQYVQNGSLVLSERHGNNDGYKFDVVKLNFPAEHVTSVSGYKSSNHSRLCSITFGTNHGNYGPFGKFSDHDKEFSFKLGDDRQFGGFHGTANDNGVKSIGVYLQPNMTLDYLNTNVVKPANEGESWEVLNELHI